MLQCLEHGSDYDVASPLSNRGRHALIEELSVEANIIYKQLEHGIRILQATVRLNQFRETLTPPADPVSWSCVRRFVCESLVIRSHRRQTKKGAISRRLPAGPLRVGISRFRH